MAKCSKQIANFLPGMIVVLLIATVIFAALIALWSFAINHGDDTVYFDSYLWRVLSFTFIQAILSTLISLLLAIILAKAIYQADFYAKSWLLNALSLTFVLPSLVVITGLLSVYGSHGIIAVICQYMNVDYNWSIYGLNGILIAHVFLNFPFATKYCYQSLLLIPNEQKQLAQQLGLSYLQTFRYLELPVIFKQLLPLGGLIFMLCFSSFATVLALSGGPKYTTIEVAIYQAIRDFELYQGVILSLIQLVFCLLFIMLLKKLEPKQSPLLNISIQPYMVKIPRWQKYLGFVFIGLCIIFIGTPLLSIIINGIFHYSYLFFTPLLIQSLLTSIIVAVCSALLAMAQGISILWTNSYLLRLNKKRLSSTLILLASLTLAVPSMVLSAGFFILFYHLIDIPGLVYLLVIVSNSFLALPFIIKQLSTPLADLTKQYYCLSQSLNIRGIHYFYLIEFKALKKLFLSSFAFACIMSMGDFGIVALFGGQDFMTLPYYLYDLITHYRYEEASFTALLLLLLSFLFITLFEYSHHDRT